MLYVFASFCITYDSVILLTQFLYKTWYSQYEIRWGKAWEIWSRVVPSGRRMVDTRRAVPNEESRHPVLCCLSKRWMSERKPFARRMIDTVCCSQHCGRIDVTSIYPPPPPPPPPPRVCVPSIYLMSLHMTGSPRPSSAVFHTGSDQIVVVGLYLVYSIHYAGKSVWTANFCACHV